MTTQFKLTGLSKPRSFTMETSSGEIFWATADENVFPQERFDALFNYAKGNWSEKKQAVIEHDGFAEDGTPINPKVIMIKEV